MNTTAIISSGLGWVRRGNEAWAQGLAEALHAAGTPVTLFGGGPLSPQCPYQRGTTVRRDHPLWRRCLSWGRRYGLEQSLFASSLARQLRPSGHDIAHTGDPQIASGLHRRRPTHGATVIYKDGLLLGPDWNRNFEWVQVLAPHYLEAGTACGLDTRRWRMIPHFIEPDRFVTSRPRGELRRELLGRDLPPDAILVLAAGALAAQSNKRLDWVAREVAPVPSAHLLVVGQADRSDEAAFEAAVRPMLGDRLQVRTNLDPAVMPKFFQAADVFAHGALREPFGLVLIEALAAGLPVLGHIFPVTRWIIGDGGESLDMEEPGALTTTLKRLANSPTERAALGARARARAVAKFSPEVILPRYAELYTDIRREREAATR